MIRKVISSAREKIAANESKSQNSAQANVGFRPSMTFTVEGEESPSTAIGQPIDLFFLFDASASQNNQITEMLNSAKKIVKKFAGDSSNKDICHVGSALFMGPTIRLMCS